MFILLYTEYFKDIHNCQTSRIFKNWSYIEAYIIGIICNFDSDKNIHMKPEEVRVEE
jgi:hypothetical protein